MCGFGHAALSSLRIAWIGDGNNMAHSLMFAASKAGMDFAIAAPEGYWMDAEVTAQGEADAQACGTTLLQTTNPNEAVAGAHAVYTALQRGGSE